MPTPGLWTPAALYPQLQPVGALIPTIVNIGAATLYTLEFRGATGSVTLESLQGDQGGAAALTYSLSPDMSAPISTGALAFVNGTRIFMNTAAPFIRISGSVATGALGLWFIGWPFAPPPEVASPFLLALDGAAVGPLNALPVQQMGG